jgi:hypothetical protein
VICFYHFIKKNWLMKTFLRISLKQTLFTGTIAVLALSIIFLQDNVVQGKNAALHALTNTPLAGAKIVLTKVSGNSTAQAILSTTSGSDGSFTFPAVTTTQRGDPGMITYTLTVTPAITYTVTDSKTTGPKAVPNTAPVKVSVTLNQLRGLTSGGTLANSGPIGPFIFMSNDSLRIGLAFAGAVSGTVSKQ